MRLRQGLVRATLVAATWISTGTAQLAQSSAAIVPGEGTTPAPTAA